MFEPYLKPFSTTDLRRVLRTPEDQFCAFGLVDTEGKKCFVGVLIRARTKFDYPVSHNERDCCCDKIADLFDTAARDFGLDVAVKLAKEACAGELKQRGEQIL